MCLLSAFISWIFTPFLPLIPHLFIFPFFVTFLRITHYLLLSSSFTSNSINIFYFSCVCPRPSSHEYLWLFSISSRSSLFSPSSFFIFVRTPHHLLLSSYFTSDILNLLFYRLPSSFITWIFMHFLLLPPPLPSSFSLVLAPYSILLNLLPFFPLSFSSFPPTFSPLTVFLLASNFFFLPLSPFFKINIYHRFFQPSPACHRGKSFATKLVRPLSFSGKEGG